MPHSLYFWKRSVVKGSMVKWRQGVRGLQGARKMFQSHSNKMKMPFLCQHVSSFYFLCLTMRDPVCWSPWKDAWGTQSHMLRNPLACTALVHPTLPHSPACSLLFHSFIHQRTAGQGTFSQASCSSGPPEKNRKGAAERHITRNAWSAEVAVMGHRPMVCSHGQRWSHVELKPGFTCSLRAILGFRMALGRDGSWLYESCT